MDAREGPHVAGFRDSHGRVLPIDHPDHEDHDPGREMMKGGVRIVGVVLLVLVLMLLVVMVLRFLVELLRMRALHGQSAILMPMESVGHREAGFSALAARWRCARAVLRAFSTCM
jgi:hypothetical protein